MQSRFLGLKPLFAVAVLTALLIVLFARPVLAQNKAVEAQARALQKKAMEDDYLATDFAKAQDKLNQAIAKCGTDKCSPEMRARLKRDLGVVQIGGQLDKDKGTQNFAEAQALDPSLQLDPDLKNKDLEAAWDAAKRPATATPTPAGTGATNAPAGDFTHTPITEQLVRTPVPVHAEYTGSEAVVRVVIRYKGFGMTEFKAAEAKKTAKGWGANIPCMDVQQGDMLYYIQGFNEEKDVVATGGDRNRPYKVSIKRDKIDGEPPHLPGESPIKQCADSGDCPPDFPGCKGSGTATTPEPKGKAEGDDCEEDSDCTSATCKNKVCAGLKSDTKLRRLWIGVSAAVDFTLLSSADNVCRLNNSDKTPLNSAGYYCTNPNGTDYPDRNDKNGTENKNIVADKSDKVSGGSALGNIRVMLTFDYALNTNFMIGGRLGYNLLTYPGAGATNDGKASSIGFLHLEARATYLIGKDALLKTGMAGYVFLGAGYSEFTGKVGVTVVEQGQNQNKSVDAWLIGGPVFASLGGGIRYAISPRAAILGGPRLNFAFGNTFAPSAGLEMGVQFGF